jgi:hypothetical protein
VHRRHPSWITSQRGLLALPVAALALAFAPGGGQAGVIFTTGSTPAGTKSLALAVTPADTVIGAFTVQGAVGTSTTAFGQLTGGGPDLLQLVTDTPLTTTAPGQARSVGGVAAVVGQLLLLKARAPGLAWVEAFSGTNLFTTATLTPAGTGTGFSSLGLSPHALAPEGGTGYFSLTATDQFGATFTSPVFALGGGPTVVDALGRDGTVITKLTLTAFSDSAGTSPAALVNDFRQVRAAFAPAAVTTPEPATVVSALSGLAVCGLAGLRRRRSAAA